MVKLRAFCISGMASHITMAARAADAFGNVDGMVEVGVVRQVADPVPDEWLVLGQAAPDRCEQSSIRPYLRMARHACIGGRQSSICRCFHRGVTEATVDAETCDMMLMAERHRLFDRPTSVTQIVSTRPKPPPCGAGDHRAGETHENEFCNKVRSGWKDRGHLWREMCLRDWSPVLRRKTLRCQGSCPLSER